jgi:hypothetical protein
LPDLAVTRVHDGHSVNVMLNEGDLTATGAALRATAGQDFAAVAASFTDPGPNPGQATDYRAVIDWGDGTPLSLGGISVGGAGTCEVPASHTYAAAGEYQVVVTITDNRDPNRAAVADTTIRVMAPGAPGRAGGGPRGAWLQEVAAALRAGPTAPWRPVLPAVGRSAETAPVAEDTVTRLPLPAPAREAWGAQASRWRAQRSGWAAAGGGHTAQLPGPLPAGHADLLDVLAMDRMV